jgi:ribosome recycling factor
MQDEMSRDATQRMSKCVATLREHFRRMRTGRANTGLLDGLKVEYYGSEVPLSQGDTTSVRESSTLMLATWLSGTSLP